MGLDFNYDLDTYVQFFKDKWLFLVIALVVLFIVVRIVKTVVKWLIVVAILAGVVFYSGHSLEELKNLGSELGTKVADSVKQEAISAMAGEAQDATFTTNSDGTFTVKTKNLALDGTPGQKEVKVTFRGTPLGTWKIDATIQSLIDQAKKNV
ncbi:hypothetical protein [Paenibacillus sp. CF384]|uniref:hypothetical protein n=1 Tax=Paenibacillus sp. CF384 TaxID=1884382 RepID=UPI00089490E4|nr:hypothetical protein [Paenibacillus sp. CF384]SDX68335.1 hypothetical protein SAMN05518855_1018158 [Paenibacillus sp. CF384]